MADKIQQVRNLVESLGNILGRGSVLENSTANHQSDTTGGLNSSSPYHAHQTLFGYQPRSTRKRPTATAYPSKKKPKKDIPWSHTFVCLADTEADCVPKDYSVLTANGLGKMKLQLFESSDAMDIHETIIKAFPKLDHAGGYDFLRTEENSKSVQDIIEMIKKDNCIIISDGYDSYDEDSILDIDIRRDFLLKDAIREGKKQRFFQIRLLGYVHAHHFNLMLKVSS